MEANQSERVPISNCSVGDEKERERSESVLKRTEQQHSSAGITSECRPLLNRFISASSTVPFYLKFCRPSRNTMGKQRVDEKRVTAMLSVMRYNGGKFSPPFLSPQLNWPRHASIAP